MSLRIAPLLVLLAMCTACAGWGDKEAETPGVSFLEYSPKPFYEYMTDMRVTFTTTAPAEDDRKYVVQLTTGLDSAHRDCSREHVSEPVSTGAGRTRRVTLAADGKTSFCSGKARLAVRAQGANFDVHALRSRSLRILPAHPRGGYSPLDRAIQMAAEAYRWFGDKPPDDLDCPYTGTEGNGAQWFYCGPRGVEVACSSKTTDRPLSGKSNREYLSWGDCGID